MSVAMKLYRELETVPSFIGRVAEATFFLCIAGQFHNEKIKFCQKGVKILISPYDPLITASC